MHDDKNDDILLSPMVYIRKLKREIFIFYKSLHFSDVKDLLVG